MKVKSLSRVRLLATPWTAAHQAPPSMGFSRQEYWSGVPLPSPNTNIWSLKNTFLNNQQITEEIKICIETNENENTTSQNLWNTVKAVLMGRFIAIQAYLMKQEKNQINNLTLHIKQLEKEEMKNP